MTEAKESIIKEFNGTEIDFIKDNDSEIWLTSSTIAKGLEIDIRNVNQIYQNNKELLESHTCVMKIMMEDQHRSTRVFNRTAFIWICVRSNSPKALPFQEWVLNVINEIMNKGYYLEEQENQGPYDILIKNSEATLKLALLIKEQSEKITFLENKVGNVNSELKAFENKYEDEKPIRTQTVKIITDMVYKCVKNSGFHYNFFYKKIWDHFGIRSTKGATEPVGQQIIEFIKTDPVLKNFLEE